MCDIALSLQETFLDFLWQYRTQIFGGSQKDSDHFSVIDYIPYVLRSQSVHACCPF